MKGKFHLDMLRKKILCTTHKKIHEMTVIMAVSEAQNYEKY